MDIKLIVSRNISRLMSQSQTLDTVKKVSARAGIGFGTVRRARNGDGNTTVENLAAIARAFGVKPEDLLRDLDAEDQPEVVQMPIAAVSQRQKKINTIAGLLETIDDTGIAIVFDKCRDIAKEFPYAVKQTLSS